MHSLGLEQYERAFAENDVDAEVLPELTAEDLVSLGIISVGHRRKLLAAIAGLREHGAAKAGPSHRPAAPASLQHPAPAERRQLTVLFCDLVGSTALSTRFDPEDLREILAAYRDVVAQITADGGGFLARYMGDGVLVYFGYPQAHEDDAERAVRAGLGVVAAVGRIAVKSVRLEARVGIATGLVVVGDLIGEGSAEEQSVVGETPNLAARLQGLAEPGSVVISAGTRRLLGTLFEYRDLGVVDVKGIDGAVPAFEVLRSSVVVSRFEALHGGALSRLVGRDEEIDLLLRRWARASAGDGQVVLVTGEAGIGKSLVAATLNERLEGETAIRLRYFCSPYHQDSPLHPFVVQLGRAAGIAADDPPAIRLAKLEALARSAALADEDVAFLAELMSLPPPRDATPELSAPRKKQRTLEALARQVEGLSRQQPVLMIVEDAHWIDPTSLELLDLLVDRVRRLPVLLVVTFRPEFQPAWAGQSRVSVLALNRLDRGDRAALVLQVAAGKALPDEVVDEIVDRTDGVPLFVEELTKSVLESGLLREEAGRYVLDRALQPFAIPTSLHDSLMARLDRLGPMRQVAQMGAAIGREFSYGLLQTVSRLPAEELQAALERLVASEMISQRGNPPQAVYAFKHALVQDVAHESLLRSARRDLHARIADALAADFPELIDTQPELLARHYADAGLVEKSVTYWGKAGQRSAARSAMAEAAAQLQKGLDQLALLPESDQRRRQELEFWSALGAALRFVKGQATPEMGHAYARARELWEELGSPSEFLHIPYGESFYRTYRGEFEMARRLDDDLLRLSRQRNDVPGLVLGHASAGRTLIYAGRFAAARHHLEEALAIYDPTEHGSLGLQSGSDPRPSARGQLGIALFCLGFPDQAFAQGNAAIREALSLAHAPSVATGLALAARLFCIAGDTAALDKCVDRLIDVAAEQRFPHYRALGAIYRGWSKVLGGDVGEGIALLRGGSSDYRAAGTDTRGSFHVALVAQACEIAGQVEEALSLAEEALQSADRLGERWFAAELHRLKGRLLQHQGYAEAAEQYYGKALTIAREQEARLWELRAATACARLRREQGDADGAHDLLASVYSWFSEGFGIPELDSARALLVELESGRT